MNVKASDVKALRDRTGAGMMACKKALTESGNDLEAAIDLLRKAGEAKALKSSARTAAEGRITIAANDNATQVTMVEVNCETDFTGKNDDFIAFANDVAQVALNAQATTAEAILALAHPSGEGTIEMHRQNLSSKIGEKIDVRRVSFKQADVLIGHYNHRNTIGVQVILDKADPELAKEIALHVVAMNPKAIDSSGVPAELLERERKIFLEQAKESGKPENIAEKMVEGRIKKFLREISLVEQPFFKDPDQTIGQMLQKADTKIIEFTRLELGEGIEKENTDFATEVMEQAKGNSA